MHKGVVNMAILTIHNISDQVQQHLALRLRTTQHGHSMEAEGREILESTVRPQ